MQRGGEPAVARRGGRAPRPAVARDHKRRRDADRALPAARRQRANEQEHAALFDDEERERVVEAYAAKLKASREEMIRKIIDSQAVERTKCLEELKKDVQNVLQEVVQECRNEFAEQRQKDEEEDAKRRDAPRPPRCDAPPLPTRSAVSSGTGSLSGMPMTAPSQRGRGAAALLVSEAAADLHSIRASHRHASRWAA